MGPKHNLPREKRPPLTHFLCLPLVNFTSMSQLEASISAFKKDYPPVAVTDLLESCDRSSTDNAPRTLIPEGAVRPLGTLHLTLGVMSLPSQKRLDEAISFLKTLDLANLVYEAELASLHQKEKRHSHRQSIPAVEAKQSPHQLSISLESLHALPQAKSATVLYASPVDYTGRLYPLCLMLRDKFIEAGFMDGDSKDKEQAKSNADGKQSQQEVITTSTRLNPYTAAITRKPKPRPLLLHATIVNTIYVRGRPRPGPKPAHGSLKSTKGKNVPNRFDFDARGILERYKDYYVDESRTVLRDTVSSTTPSTSRPARKSYPFVWAKDIPIDSVCICEMGAKKLDPDDHGTSDLNARLGQEYTVVASRTLDSAGR
ncbi:hypothetical protein N7490_000081 [Penicillium lividum]|nr:hypothetical protein N7490_000081 [Penicillium lividum]